MEQTWKTPRYWEGYWLSSLLLDDTPHKDSVIAKFLPRLVNLRNGHQNIEISGKNILPNS